MTDPQRPPEKKEGQDKPPEKPPKPQEVADKGAQQRLAQAKETQDRERKLRLGRVEKLSQDLGLEKKDVEDFRRIVMGPPLLSPPPQAQGAQLEALRKQCQALEEDFMMFDHILGRTDGIAKMRPEDRAPDKKSIVDALEHYRQNFPPYERECRRLIEPRLQEALRLKRHPEDATRDLLTPQEFRQFLEEFQKVTPRPETQEKYRELPPGMQKYLGAHHQYLEAERGFILGGQGGLQSLVLAVWAGEQLDQAHADNLIARMLIFLTQRDQYEEILAKSAPPPKWYHRFLTFAAFGVGLDVLQRVHQRFQPPERPAPQPLTETQVARLQKASAQSFEEFQKLLRSDPALMARFEAMGIRNAQELRELFEADREVRSRLRARGIGNIPTLDRILNTLQRSAMTEFAHGLNPMEMMRGLNKIDFLLFVYIMHASENKVKAFLDLALIYGASMPVAAGLEAMALKMEQMLLRRALAARSATVARGLLKAARIPGAPPVKLAAIIAVVFFGGEYIDQVASWIDEKIPDSPTKLLADDALYLISLGPAFDLGEMVSDRTLGVQVGRPEFTLAFLSRKTMTAEGGTRRFINTPGQWNESVDRSIAHSPPEFRPLWELEKIDIPEDRNWRNSAWVRRQAADFFALTGNLRRQEVEFGARLQAAGITVPMQSLVAFATDPSKRRTPGQQGYARGAEYLEQCLRWQVSGSGGAGTDNDFYRLDQAISQSSDEQLKRDWNVLKRNAFKLAERTDMFLHIQCYDRDVWLGTEEGEGENRRVTTAEQNLRDPANLRPGAFVREGLMEQVVYRMRRQEILSRIDTSGTAQPQTQYAANSLYWHINRQPFGGEFGWHRRPEMRGQAALGQVYIPGALLVPTSDERRKELYAHQSRAAILQDPDGVVYYDPTTYVTRMGAVGELIGSTQRAALQMVTENASLFILRPSLTRPPRGLHRRDDLATEIFPQPQNQAPRPLVLASLPGYSRPNDPEFQKVMEQNIRTWCRRLCTLETGDDARLTLANIETVVLQEESFTEEKRQILPPEPIGAFLFGESKEFIKPSRTFTERNHVLHATFYLRDGTVVRRSIVASLNPNTVERGQQRRADTTENWRNPTVVEGATIVNTREEITQDHDFQRLTNEMEWHRRHRITADAMAASNAANQGTERLPENNAARFRPSEELSNRLYGRQLHQPLVYVSDPDGLMLRENARVLELCQELAQPLGPRNPRLRHEGDPHAVFIELTRRPDGEIVALATYVESPLRADPATALLTPDALNTGRWQVRRRAAVTAERQGQRVVDGGLVLRPMLDESRSLLRRLGNPSEIFTAVYQQSQERISALAAPHLPRLAQPTATFVQVAEGVFGLRRAPRDQSPSVILSIPPRRTGAVSREMDVRIREGAQYRTVKLQIVLPDPEEHERIILHYPEGGGQSREWRIADFRAFLLRDDVSHQEKQMVRDILTTPRGTPRETIERIFHLFPYELGAKDEYLKQLVADYERATDKKLFLEELLERCLREGSLRADNREQFNFRTNPDLHLTIRLEDGQIQRTIDLGGGFALTIRARPDPQRPGRYRYQMIQNEAATKARVEIFLVGLDQPGPKRVDLQGPPPQGRRTAIERLHIALAAEVALTQVRDQFVQVEDREYQMQSVGGTAILRIGQPITSTIEGGRRVVPYAWRQVEGRHVVKFGSEIAYRMHDRQGNLRQGGDVVSARDLRNREENTDAGRLSRTAFDLLTTPVSCPPNSPEVERHVRRIADLFFYAPEALDYAFIPVRDRFIENVLSLYHLAEDKKQFLQDLFAGLEGQADEQGVIPKQKETDSSMRLTRAAFQEVLTTLTQRHVPSEGAQRLAVGSRLLRENGAATVSGAANTFQIAGQTKSVQFRFDAGRWEWRTAGTTSWEAVGTTFYRIQQEKKDLSAQADREHREWNRIARTLRILSTGAVT